MNVMITILLGVASFLAAMDSESGDRADTTQALQPRVWAFSGSFDGGQLGAVGQGFISAFSGGGHSWGPVWMAMSSAGGAYEASSRWLGLGCNAASEALRAQLGLGEEGIVVYDVVDQGPAHVAGVQKHDIFTKAVVGDKEFTLRTATDLGQAVKAAGEKPIKLVGLRSGKPYEVEVTPADRPQPAVIGLYQAPGFAPPVPPLPIDPERVKQLLKENRIEELKEYVNQLAQRSPLPFELRMAGPIVTPPLGTQVVPHDLPENVTVTITRTGKEPAQIQVKIGDQSWVVNEHELDKLPEKVRGYVEGLLHGTIARTWKARIARPNVTQPKGKIETLSPVPQPASPVVPAKPAPHDATAELKERLERQQQQLDALLKQLQELKQSLEKQSSKDR